MRPASPSRISLRNIQTVMPASGNQWGPMCDPCRTPSMIKPIVDMAASRGNKERRRV
jgi:hypothetical protein